MSERILDVAPGYGDEGGGRGLRAGFTSYFAGLALALALTGASFWAADTHLIYGPGIPAALVTLALAQMGIHLVFFLHMTTAPDNTNNVLALAFGILVVFLVVAGSLWIMTHLSHMMVSMGHMMVPMDQMMPRQR